MRNIIDLFEAANRRDPRLQYHLSVEPNLVPLRSFDRQTRTISHAGERGEAGGEGIYTTHNVGYWSSQLAYEDNGEYPRYCYLVWVRAGGEASSIDSAHQEVSDPGDVVVLALLDDIGDADGPPVDVGKIEWKADKWVSTHHDVIARLSNG